MTATLTEDKKVTLKITVAELRRACGKPTRRLQEVEDWGNYDFPAANISDEEAVAKAQLYIDTELETLLLQYAECGVRRLNLFRITDQRGRELSQCPTPNSLPLFDRLIHTALKEAGMTPEFVYVNDPRSSRDYWLNANW